MTLTMESLLQIGQILAYFAAAAVFVIMLKADIRILRHDMKNLTVRQDALSETLSQLTTVLTQVARQDERIAHIEEDIRELRHGHGYIDKDKPRRMNDG